MSPIELFWTAKNEDNNNEDKILMIIITCRFLNSTSRQSVGKVFQRQPGEMVATYSPVHLPEALSVFNPECMIAWSTMGPTSKQNEWTMEF